MASARRIAIRLLGVLLLLALGLAAAAWFSPPVAEKLFELSGQRNRPVPPFRIADDFYYVGSSDGAAYLLVSDRGHILIDGGYEGTAPQILRNIRALGFDPRQIRILLNTHGHFDHAAGLATMLRETGATLYASPREKLLLEAGGRGDFHYGDHLSYEPVKVGHVLADRETVRLGSIALTAHFTPGHTKGCTSWEIPLTIEGKPESGLLICSLSLVGSPLRSDPAYPDIAVDFEASFGRLKGLPCDIFLLPHAKAFGLSEKRAALANGDARAFVDPAGCASFIREKEAIFRKELD